MLPRGRLSRAPLKFMVENARMESMRADVVGEQRHEAPIECGGSRFKNPRPQQLSMEPHIGVDVHVVGSAQAVFNPKDPAVPRRGSYSHSST